MATTTGLRLTKAGQRLLGKVHGGAEKLVLTRFVLGDALWTAQEIEEGALTALKNKRLSAPVASMKLGEGDDAGRLICTGTFQNTLVDTAFYVREIGLMALDPQEGEILYLVDPIPEDVPTTVIEAKGVSQHVPVRMELLAVSGDQVEIKLTDNTVVVNHDQLKRAIVEERVSSHLGSFKNLLINGDFRVWQRGEVFEEIRSVFIADRWTINATGMVYLANVSRSIEFFGRDCVKIETLVYSGEYLQDILTILDIEVLKQIAGRTCTISFWAKTDTPYIPRFGLDGIVAGVGVCRVDRNLMGIDEEWRYYTLTFDVPEFDFRPTSDLNDYFRLWLGLGPGTQWFANIQLELGEMATKFEYRPLSVEKELCYYYFERIGGTGENPFIFGSGTASSIEVGRAYLYAHYRPKRKKPVINFGGVFSLRTGYGITNDITSAELFITGYFSNKNAEILVDLSKRPHYTEDNPNGVAVSQLRENAGAILVASAGSFIDINAEP